MFKLEQGTLTMSNIAIEHIQGRIEEGETPKTALSNELSFSGLNIKDVQSIQLQCSQMQNKTFVDIYAKVVCDFWNN